MPIFLRRPSTLREAGIYVDAVEAGVEAELIGTESDYLRKIIEGVGGEPQGNNWIVEAKPGRYLIRGGMCGFLRALAARSSAAKVFDELRLIKGREGLVVTARTLVKCSGRIISTMPLDYVARKAGCPNAPSPPYASLYITAAVLTVGHAPEHVEVKFLGKRRYASLVIVSMPAEHVMRPANAKDSLIVYAVAVLRKGRVDPSIRQKALSDLKRAGYDIRSARLIRSHFERYGILGHGGSMADELKSYLSEQGVKPAGRLGLWRELSVEEVLHLARRVTQ